MNKENQVVGFRVPLVKDGQIKEVVVPATPELQQQVEPKLKFEDKLPETIKQLKEIKNPWAK